MSEHFLFPRLPMAACLARFAEVQGKDISELTALAATQSNMAVFGATGGARVSESTIVQLRADVLRAASDLGFPGPDRRHIAMSFDPAVGALLLNNMPISPGEASRDDVWAFLSLVLLPDVAAWRFPEQNQHRLMGGPRNTFQRLWWRAHLLRDAAEQNPFWLLQLPEDALVGLMERPALSSNPGVTVAIARAIHKLAQLPGARREDAWRTAYKRIRQRLVLINFEFLLPADLQALIEAACTPAALNQP